MWYPVARGQEGEAAGIASCFWLVTLQSMLKELIFPDTWQAGALNRFNWFWCCYSSHPKPAEFVWNQLNQDLQSDAIAGGT